MEKMKKDEAVTAVSIHSSRVSSCIAVLDSDGRPLVTGLGRAEGRLTGSMGVLDIDKLSRAVSESLSAAQSEAGINTPSAFVGISGGSIKGEKSRGIIRLSQRAGEITAKNIKDVLKIADTVPISIERQIIHSAPQSFVVDGQREIKNPIGLYGVKLEAETLITTAAAPFLHNIVKCLNLAGEDVEDIVFSGYATARCVLSDETEAKGIALIEIDDNFTALSVFFDNTLIGIEVMAGSVITEGVLPGLKKRLDEIRGAKPISRIILSGGSYVHEDFIEKVDTLFGVPSQMAYPRGIRNTAKDFNNPAHLTSIGLAVLGLTDLRNGMYGKKARSGFITRATRRVSEFLNDYF